VLPDFQSYVAKHALLRPGDRVGVAVSGGADSVALLRCLLEAREEFGIVLSVVHFNHKLRNEDSELDEQFVGQLATRFDVPFQCDSADTRRFAREKELSLEAAARELRYTFFGRLVREGQLDKVATAHTLDDQAETVLLRLLRGTGTSGLAAVLPRLKVAEGAIVRPFLGSRRCDVLEYLNQIAQTWREDSSNVVPAFTRNRVRHQLVPLLETSFNPHVTVALANLAEVARAEDEFWSTQTAEAFVSCARPDHLDSAALCRLPLALQRRVVRLAAIQKGITLDFEHTERILDLIKGTRSNAGRTIELPNGFRATVGSNAVQFESTEVQARPCGFARVLTVPGEVAIPELRILVRTTVISKGSELDGYNDDRRLALSRVGSELLVRNWRPGDRFWPAHTRSEKKVKELLQERHLPARAKALWPVALSGDEIVWMRGFPVSSRHLAKNENAVLIEELPLSPEHVP
jgi:tRNA(Ile)-lysidine synthase